MSQAPVPTVGRMVLYTRYGSPGGEHKPEVSPAVIAKVNDEVTGQCQLFIMNPNGLYFNDTPYSAEPKPGHWHWMQYQKDQHARHSARDTEEKEKP